MQALWAKLTGSEAAASTTNKDTTASSPSEKAKVYNDGSQPFLGVLPELATCTATEVASLVGHEDRVWCVDWHPSGAILASCGGDKTVRLWSRDSSQLLVKAATATNDDAVVSFKCICVLDGEHSRTVRCVAWSPDGTRLACSSFDSTVTIWKKSSPQFDMALETVLDGHDNEVKSVAWDAQGRLLATCSRDKSVWVWDGGDNLVAGAQHANEAEEADDNDNETVFECAAVMVGHTQDVKCVRWDPDDSGRVFSTSYDDTIKIWEESPQRKDDWSCVQTLTGHTSTVWDFSLQKRAFCGAASAGREELVPVYSADTGEVKVLNRATVESLMHSRKRQRDSDDCGNVHPLPRIAVSCADDKTLRIWRNCVDPVSGKMSWSCAGTVASGVHDRAIYSVEWLPPLPIVAKSDGEASSSDSTVNRKVEETRSQLLITASGDDSFAIHQLISAAEADNDASSTVASPLTLQTLLKVSNAHPTEINCARCSPHVLVSERSAAFIVATAADDGVVKLWKIVVQW